MTRKEREAVEDAIVEDQLRKLNAECDAEVAARYSNHGVGIGSMDFTDERALALPKSHPARFLHFYGGSAWPDRPSTASLAAAKRLLWAFRHPFGADLAACAETNS